MKLLICDDDRSTIEVLESQIEWQQLHVDTLLRAYNGVAATQIIAREKPDIVLCDIGMPLMNGLEVLKFIYNNGFDARFVFLTCYADFEYAREALRYGASNYLTKPLDLDEVKNAVEKLVQEINAEHRNEGNAVPDPLHEAFLSALINGKLVSVEEIDKALEREKLPLTSDSLVRTVFVSVDWLQLTDPENNLIEEELGAFRVLIRENLTEPSGHCCLSEESTANFFLSCLLVESGAEPLSTLRNRCSRLIAQVQQALDLSPVCVIARPLPLKQIPAAWQELRRFVLAQRLRCGKVVAEEESEDAILTGAVFHLSEETIQSYVRKEDREAYLGLVNSTLALIAANGDRSDSQMTLFHHELLFSFLGLLRDNHLPTSVLLTTDSQRQRSFYAERSVKDMRLYALDLFDTVSRLLHQDGHSEIVCAALQYISANYCSSIDRAEIAASVFVSANYLSKCFQTEMQMGLREYINQMRINEAKRLLITTDLPVSQIASQVGFDNISYFSTIFHKQCGMRPIEWRSSMRQEAAEMNSEGSETRPVK